MRAGTRAFVRRPPARPGSLCLCRSLARHRPGPLSRRRQADHQRHGCRCDAPGRQAGRHADTALSRLDPDRAWPRQDPVRRQGLAAGLCQCIGVRSRRSGRAIARYAGLVPERGRQEPAGAGQHGHRGHRHGRRRQEHQPGGGGGKARARACGKTASLTLVLAPILSALSGEKSMSRILAFLCGALLAATPVLAQSAPKFGKWGVDLTSLDASVKPGDNFFLHVNGGWLKTAQIPADRSSTGSFQDLQILSEERLKTIVADLEKTPEQRLSEEERKLRDLYDAFVDTDAIEARGLAPVRADLDYLEHLKTLDDVGHAMGSIRLSTTSVYNIGIGVDDKNPDNYSVNLGQAGLGMPDRDYYLSEDPQIVKTREAYRKYLADMMTLAGLSDAAARADRVLAVETEIAKVSWNRADRRDEDKVYNPMPASALKTLAPDFAWDAFLSEGQIPLKRPDGNERYVIVAEKTAFGPLAAIFKNTPVSTWSDYLVVHYLHTFSPYLPKRFDDLDFSFYGTVLTGRTQQLDRKTRAMHLLDQQLGEALGKLYVARYFPPEAKAKADLLVSNLLKAYDADIQTLEWMSPATRAKALEKLHQFTPKIGYPVKWRDYSAFRVVRDNPVGNAQRS